MDHAVIEIRLGSAAELFNTLDPSPFRAGRLDAEAEAYLLERAAATPSRAPLRLRLHLPRGAADEGMAAMLAAAFASRAAAERAAMREHFRYGRKALLTGLAGLSACLVLATFAEELVPGWAAPSIASEGLKILGWVLMWKPAEIFLYDWMPILRRRRLFERLAAAQVEIRHDEA
ncbi:hypothetical protein ACI6QG_03340 [Roseococcus sp. DSY-14]|uniref:hypothetical protein n=1 Tax=Roseococcus sp. DSY-14 TaxID=3369650 RepID=UPI00387B8508